ncbi:SAM-dependent methyltransferase [Roseivirga misakiensis]|uniref:SAM-dependent methyltransferase n=1 Tax=Roseivirga misakiensis TaxID=1563681 RepID=A0A1E5T2N5_9BACT|nr:SAM-dependent methyltransferase [Roseivirga misakiensis]
MVKLDSDYWTSRYEKGQTGWDLGSVSTPIKEYIDQLDDKSIKILIPGAGNAYEAEYLWNSGFKNIYVVDLSQNPLDNLKSRVPGIPNAQLIKGDFFDLADQFDLILEQTFFCALNPQLRKSYVNKMNLLLVPGGKLVGLLFNFPLTENGPPFGGSKEEYLSLFESKFKIDTMETAYNSIKPRMGNELFIKTVKSKV